MPPNPLLTAYICKGEGALAVSLIFSSLYSDKKSCHTGGGCIRSSLYYDKTSDVLPNVAGGDEVGGSPRSLPLYFINTLGDNVLINLQPPPLSKL